ncbi:DUF2330 domain-containing protein [Streptomyces rishiriensis]|uniref:DUF2330 domain-containing protein n=1 Tax=Streptomyces rishiriensis TaxID=68264 RepID=A0ABU0NNP1_STRRH|nr:DUF2330 domain-containing protein [Streptomyces rishiriensis]MDQ0580714.1 hypothetical protein [Streptomyces rishiriensis]
MVGFLRGRQARRRWSRGRITGVLLALLAIQLGSLVAPAYACGCGALVPGDQRQVVVGREVSAVRWDGAQEQIVMRLTVDGDADRAAWIMPVPHRATVGLGDPELFDQLAAATAPVHRTRHHFWPQDGDWPLTTGGGRAGPPPPGARPGVGVIGRERLGPFDVARLTATDPAGLDDWLRANDFALPDRLETALRPYVDRHWEYVAVRLTPESAGTALRGELEPLHLTFATDRLVYPMRLSRLAATPQSLGLYVLAAHRMEPASRIGGDRPRVTFAGPLGETTGPLAALAKGTPFLTAVAQEFPRPSRISGDHELRRAATDTAYRQVIYEDRLLALAGVPVWLLTVVGGLVVLNTVAVVVGIRWGRARQASLPRPRHASGFAPAIPAGTVPPASAPAPAPASACASASASAAGSAGASVASAAPATTGAPPVPSRPPSPRRTPPRPARPPAPTGPPPAPPAPVAPPAPPARPPAPVPPKPIAPPRPPPAPSARPTPATPATSPAPPEPPTPRTAPSPSLAPGAGPPAPNG